VTRSTSISLAAYETPKPVVPMIGDLARDTLAVEDDSRCAPIVGLEER
jgi:hypothetical protein